MLSSDRADNEKMKAKIDARKSAEMMADLVAMEIALHGDAKDEFAKRFFDRLRELAPSKYWT